MLSMTSADPRALEAWNSTSLWPRRQEVNQQVVESGLYSLEPLQGPAAVWCISGSGHTLTDMHICLSGDKEKQIIVLDDSCGDVKIQDSVFEGGTLTLSGTGCYVRFTNTSFHFCTLIVRGGAVVELSGSRFESGLSDGTGICILAAGEGSKVQATDCEVTGGYQALLVDSGATLDATRLVCNGAPVNGVEARGRGTRLTMVDSTVAGCMLSLIHI